MNTISRAFAVIASCVGLPVTATAAPGTVTYTYDDVGRLTSAQNSDGTAQSYTLDPAGAN